MTDAWFSMEVAQNLRWLSLLSLLSCLMAFPVLGRYRSTVMSVWMTAVAVGGLSLLAGAVGMAVGQPPHVLRILFVTGVALTFAFGSTFMLMKRGYREAELRKTLARDI